MYNIINTFISCSQHCPLFGHFFLAFCLNFLVEISFFDIYEPYAQQCECISRIPLFAYKNKPSVEHKTIQFTTPPYDYFRFYIGS